MTSLQQGTQEWLDARKGKLTASQLGGLLGWSFINVKQAYGRATGDEPFCGNAATEYGNANEDLAIAMYSHRTGNPVTRTGLHVHDEFDWLAASPDGLVGDTGMVEVKCPFYRRKDGTRVHKKVPIYYWLQMNCQMECCNRDWCDFISWHPDEMAIFRVYRNHELFIRLCDVYREIHRIVTTKAGHRALQSLARSPVVPDLKHAVTSECEYNVNYTKWQPQQPQEPQEFPFSRLLCRDADGQPTLKQFKSAAQ